MRPVTDHGSATTRMRDHSRNAARKLVGPSYERRVTGRRKSVKSPFDPLEPAIKVSVKNSGRVWGENPEVPRTTWLAGDGIGHNKRLLTIGGHLRYSSRSSRNGIPFAATMLLDNARTPFA